MRVPAVVGTSEAAGILGVEVPRITRWRKGGKMPTPAAELKATPVWHRVDVERLRDGRPQRANVELLDLMSTSEVARELGVDKSQVGRWRRAGKFPEPCVQLAAGPLWWRSQIGNFTPPRRSRSAA